MVSGMITSMKRGVVNIITKSVANTPDPPKNHILILLGMLYCMVSTSFEKRFKIRPGIILSIYVATIIVLTNLLINITKLTLVLCTQQKAQSREENFIFVI